MSADGNPAHDRMRTLTDSARKRNRKEVLAYYDKTRINIGHQHDCWMELKEGLRVQTHAEVNFSTIAHDLVNVDKLIVNIWHIFNSFFRSACSSGTKFYLRKLLKRILIPKPICCNLY
jgi:hypothetical protein